MFNPCFCISLQKGVRILAIVSLLCTIVLIVEEISLIAIKGCQGITDIKNQNPEFSDLQTDSGGFGYNATSTTSNITLPKKPPTPAPKGRRILTFDFDAQTSICHMVLSEVILSGVWIISWVFDIALAVLLVYGCQVKSIRMCTIWFYARCVILVFRVVFLIIYMIAGLPILWKIPVMLLFIFRLYSLWVVNYFIKEMTIEKVAREKPRVSVASNKNDIEKFDGDKNYGTPLW